MTLDEKIQTLTLRMADLQEAERVFKQKNDVFGAELAELLRSEGLPENFHLLQLIQHFYNKRSIISA